MPAQYTIGSRRCPCSAQTLITPARRVKIQGSLDSVRLESGRVRLEGVHGRRASLLIRSPDNGPTAQGQDRQCARAQDYSPRGPHGVSKHCDNQRLADGDEPESEPRRCSGRQRIVANLLVLERPFITLSGTTCQPFDLASMSSLTGCRGHRRAGRCGSAPCCCRAQPRRAPARTAVNIDHHSRASEHEVRLCPSSAREADRKARPKSQAPSVEDRANGKFGRCIAPSVRHHYGRDCLRVACRPVRLAPFHAALTASRPMLPSCLKDIGPTLPRGTTVADSCGELAVWGLDLAARIYTTAYGRCRPARSVASRAAWT
jgi:hypothetical protein